MKVSIDYEYKDGKLIPVVEINLDDERTETDEDWEELQPRIAAKMEEMIGMLHGNIQ